ncbi:hypothetical protein GGQ71_002950 [Rhizobium taibaishanense]|uniref:Uncharacterized protein n=1 Tax=Allorhizobium taibaishanense TaxID=887144 RepID=A0A7W6MUV5_9HYPH|nr:hypothetical protein [Allorhizobium taibaishanense]
MTAQAQDDDKSTKGQSSLPPDIKQSLPPLRKEPDMTGL